MARLSLALFGSFEVRLDGQPVTARAYDKVWALLAYLAVEAARPHRRDALLGLLWPDQPGQAARTNLRQALTRLRQAIGDHPTTSPMLLIAGETIQFNSTSDHELDVGRFAALLAACDTHPHRHPATCTSCARRRTEAIALYRGNFLEEFFLDTAAGFEEWAALKREALHDRALGACALVAGYHERRGDDAQAHDYARRQLELDPWCEEAHRQLMRLLARSGQRSIALMQYERCRQTLQDVLGVEPTAETTTLYHEIRVGGSTSAPVRHLYNLPAQATPFVGRAAEMAQLADMLEDSACRLVTLAGPGGIGKSRLAIQVADAQVWTFAQGVYLVPLASLRSADFLAQAIATAIGLALSGTAAPRPQLLRYLGDKELLLVLDNFEHLLAGVDLLAELLQRAPAVSLLVTSRERLHLPGEWVVDVGGLEYPEDSQGGTLEDYSAPQLFLQCARRARSGFVVGPEEGPWITRICQLVEGMPLGIEMAAALLRAFSCREVAQEIARSLDFLSESQGDMPARHQSMRAVLDQSWNLLAPEEQQVLRRLSVFAGGAEREAAAEVAAATPARLVGLVDKSLLRWDGTARYDLHELVRQYAGEQLTAAGEAETVRRRHAEHYLALAEQAERDLWAQSQFAAWLARLSAEHDNLRAALVWSQAGAGDRELGLRLVGALNLYWMHRTHIREANYWIAQLLASEPAHAAKRREVPLRVRARALRTAGNFAAPVEAPAFLEESAKLFLALGQAGDAALAQWFLAHQCWNQGAHERAIQLCEESQQGFRVAGDMTGVDWCLFLLSNIVREQGDLQRALSLAEKAHTLAQELRLPMSAAYALFSLSRVRLAREELAAARSAAEEALALGQQLGMPGLVPQMLLQLGRIVQAQGDIREAAALWEQALVQARDLQHLRALGEVLLELGWLEHQRDNEERALALLAESLRLHRDRGDRRFIAESLAGIAGVYQAKARTAVDMFRVVRLYAAAQSEIVAHPALLRHRERIGYAHDLAAIRSKLGGPSFAAAWAEGWAMPLEQAIAYALDKASDESTASNLDNQPT